MSRKTIRLIRDGENGGMEVGEGGGLPIATLSPPERPALRWAAMRAILMFH